MLPDDAKSVVFNGAALLGRDACAVTFVSSRAAGGDVAEVSIDGFRLGPRVRAGLHALKGGVGFGSVDIGLASRRGPRPNCPSDLCCRAWLGPSGRRSAAGRFSGLLGRPACGVQILSAGRRRMA